MLLLPWWGLGPGVLRVLQLKVPRLVLSLVLLLAWLVLCPGVLLVLLPLGLWLVL